MRQALRTKTVAGGRVSSSKTYPAPTGGWNSRDSLVSMKPNEAVILDNWFPGTTECEVRKGWSTHCNGLTAASVGKTLMVYSDASGNSKMFCATPTELFDVSSGPTAVAQTIGVTTRTVAAYQWWNFTEGNANYLMAFNGVDDPLYFNGTTWISITGASTPLITCSDGSSPKSLVGGFPFKGRLILLKTASMNFYYGAAGAAGGTFTKFSLGAEAPRGGYLMAAANWTIDGGAGIDDHAVFVTSQGDVIVYKGTDPSSANTWAKVGTFQLDRPIGRDCIKQFGNDVLIITMGGIFLLGATIAANAVDRHVAISNKIENAFIESANAWSSVPGWSATHFQSRNALLINIPVTQSTKAFQYVMNTISKSWCRFTDWPAEEFTVFNDELYYATGTEVRKCWAGDTDGGNNIVANAKTSFSYFNDYTSEKMFQLFRPVLRANGKLQYLTGFDVDFSETLLTGVTDYNVVLGGVWNVDNWDDADKAIWGGGFGISEQWSSPASFPGRCAAGKLTIATNAITISWVASDYVYEKGIGF